LCTLNRVICLNNLCICFQYLDEVRWSYICSLIFMCACVALFWLAHVQYSYMTCFHRVILVLYVYERCRRRRPPAMCFRDRRPSHLAIDRYPKSVAGPRFAHGCKLRSLAFIPSRRELRSPPTVLGSVVHTRLPIMHVEIVGRSLTIFPLLLLEWILT